MGSDVTIWNRSPHQRFKVVVGGVNLGVAFAGPWEAYSVVVANNTTQHLYLPDVDYYVPPGVVGATIPMPAVMTAQARFQAPPGLPDPAPTAGQVATLDYFAEELTPYPGVPTNISVINTPAVTISNTPAVTVTSGSVAISNTPAVTVTSGTVSIGNSPAVTVTSGTVSIGNSPAVTVTSGSVAISSGSVAITSGTVNVQNVPATQLQTQQPQTLLDTIVLAANGNSGVKTYTLAAGTHAISLLSTLTAGSVVISVQGGTSTTSYFVTNGALPTSAISGIPITFAVMSAIDPTIKVAVALSGGASGTVWVASLLDTAATIAIGNSAINGNAAVPGVPGVPVLNMRDNSNNLLPLQVLPTASRTDAAQLEVTATGLVAAAVTLTLPSVASQFHYLAFVQVVKFATALLTAAATPVLVTTTNLVGNPVLSFSAAASAAGTNEVQTIQPATPIKASAAGVATTIVCPATALTIWRVNAWYYTAT